MDEHKGPESQAAERDREEATADLLADLGQELHAVSIPSDVVEQRVCAAARGLGTRAQAFVLQGFLAVETEKGVHRGVELRRTDFDTHFNLGRHHRLVNLAQSLARGEKDRIAGRAELEDIKNQRPRFGRPLVMVGYAAYGGAVAARVGGAIREVMVGIVVGAIAGVIHLRAARSSAVDLQQSFLAALIGTLTALVLLLLFPFDGAKAVFGGMCLLVPAMVLTTGAHELASGALESGTVRMAYGGLRFLMLGFGIAVATQAWSLFGPIPPRHITSPLPWPVVLALVAAGGAALTLCLQGRRRDLPWIVGAALLTYGTHALTVTLFGGRGSPFVAALVLGIAAGLQARLPGHIPATVLIPGLLQIAPGFLGTEAMLNLFAPGQRGGSAQFLDVLVTALQLVTGLLVAELLIQRLPPVRPGAPAEARRKILRPATAGR